MGSNGSVRGGTSRSRSRTLRTGLTAVVSAGLLVGYVSHRRTADPDLPLWPASSRQDGEVLVYEGRKVTANHIRKIGIAGLHLGMPVEDAIDRLRGISSKVTVRPNPRTATPRAIVGRAAWTELAYASSLDPKALGIHRAFPTPNTIAVGSSIWPDGRERVTSIMFHVQPPISDDERQRSAGRNLMLEMTSLLEKRLGPPTIRGHGRYNEDIVVYGSQPEMLRNVPGLFMYRNCTSLGAPVSDASFTCDRRRAIQSPWLEVLGRPNGFVLHLQDGKAAYRSRYPASYERSRPYLVH